MAPPIKRLSILPAVIFLTARVDEHCPSRLALVSPPAGIMCLPASPSKTTRYSSFRKPSVHVVLTEISTEIFCWLLRPHATVISSWEWSIKTCAINSRCLLVEGSVFTSKSLKGFVGGVIFLCVSVFWRFYWLWVCRVDFYLRASAWVFSLFFVCFYVFCKYSLKLS